MSVFRAGRLIFMLPLLSTLPAGEVHSFQIHVGDRMMETTIPLPEPRLKSDCPVEGSLAARRSNREFSGEALTLAEAGQLLWAAQGVTHGEGFRTAPSAGALYPLELYLVAGRVGELEPGVYHYQPVSHSVRLRQAGDLRAEVAEAALGQLWMADAAAIVVIAAVERRTAAKYGSAAERYIAIEVGHAAQNVALQGIALGLGTGFVGAFDEEELGRVPLLAPGEEAYYLLPLGRPRKPVPCGEP
jgi:SagB-type dehydrogenase family enzyme